MSSLLTLMDESPPSLYTRGGIELWLAIKNDIGNKPLPNNCEELRLIFSDSFQKITGYSIESKGMKYLDELNTGGMSGGYFYPEYFYEAILVWLDAKLNGRYIDYTHPVFIKWLPE